MTADGRTTDGPTADEVAADLMATFAGADLVTSGGSDVFSLEPEKAYHVVARTGR